MRTTISISDDLLQEAKRAALERRVSLSEVVDDALRTTLRCRLENSNPIKIAPLKTFRGTGLQPGVDLSDSADLLSVMED